MSAQKLQFSREFLNNFRRDFGIRDVWPSNIYFFLQNFLDYSTKSFSLLACQSKRVISIAFFIKAMRFHKTETIFVRDLLHFVSIFFPISVYSSRCVTHGVRRAPVKILLHAGVLICRAETSVLVNEVTVLSCSITGFFNLQHTKIDFWQLKLSVIFTFKTTYTVGVSNEGFKLYYKRYFA